MSINPIMSKEVKVVDRIQDAERSSIQIDGDWYFYLDPLPQNQSLTKSNLRKK